MKKAILINRTRMILSLLLLTVVLNSCSIFDRSDKTQETHIDPNGNVYYIKNENYFKFDSYNVLEITVSDSEKFILYDNMDDAKESGVGEWHKNGAIFPVCFDNYAKTSKTLHDDIIVMYNEFAMAYIDMDVRPETTPFIAKIRNDTKEPEICWWESGNFAYNAKFGEPQSVEYDMRNRNEKDQWSYIPSNAYLFYNVDPSQQTTFSCQELNFEWDAMTGKGNWLINNIVIPIRVWFDIDSFSVYVTYDTEDSRDGQYIFIGRGQSIEENVAFFVIESAPDIYSNTFNFFTVTKITQ